MDLDRAIAFSHYARRLLAAEPLRAQALQRALDTRFEWSDPLAAIERACDAGDAALLDSTLRRTRADLMLHTIARDLTGRASLAEVCGNVTRLADLAITASTSLHHRALAAKHGEPIGEETGKAQTLVVVAMGKLGGGELNVSSDVDLVFVYPDEGETDGARPISNREFFERLGRRLIASLGDTTAEGFVFRVDMRLRPYGDAGPLAVPFSALEHYLVTQGRTWERYAWLKARAVTGDAEGELATLVDPFVYRKYLDYDAYEGLRDVHRQIREQGERRDYAGNIKLGPGGIREIEFVTQAVQIVRAGRDPALRWRGTLPALAAIGERGLLPAASIDELSAAYVFLRNVEHRLQYRDDQQTQQLPADAADREWLAESMGAADAATFERELGRVRQAVSAQFAALLGDTPPPRERDRPFADAWDDPGSAEAASSLGNAGFDDVPSLVARLRSAKSSPRYLQLPGNSRQRFDALVPQLLAVAAAEREAAGAPQPVFARLFDLLEAVSRRSAYLALLVEHPPLLPRLAHLVAASAWAADYLKRHPILLDELLDARVLLAEPDWDEWRSELAMQMAQHGDDTEAQMDALRHFQHAQTFRLLAQDVAGRLTVERLADHLSALADIVLESAMIHCWRALRGAAAAPPCFAIIGYGKLGGKELGYASDLDIVFVYDFDPADADADELPQRYARLAQRIVSWVTMTTAAGQLYDTDLRLRPDGDKGLMVSRLPAFFRYQREQAWTWEHQALTRARFVAGDRALGAQFEAGRDALLRLPRDAGSLASEVVAMRRRMLAGHPNATPLFDLKHDPGGMVDIEFAVQYLVLVHAHDHPELTRNAGNIALVQRAGELGLVPLPLAREVADAYRLYRRLQHALRLQGATHARVEPPSVAGAKRAVDALWRTVFGQPWNVAA